MKNLIKIFIIIILISFSFELFAKELTIATYNVRFLYDSNKDSFNDPYTEDEKRPSKKEDEKKALANVISKLDADIIALQEVESIGVLNDFNKNYLNNKYEYISLIEGNNVVGIDVAIMSKIPIYSSTSFRHQSSVTIDGEKCYFARDLLLVSFKMDSIIEDKEGFFFIAVVHLKSSYGGYKENQIKRLHEINLIKNIVKDYTSYFKDFKYILLGDFNDTDSSPVIKAITSKNGLNLINPSENIKDKKQRRTFSSKKPSKQIDYIFFSDKMYKYFVKDSIKVYNEDDNLKKASDHLPIYCKIKL